MSGLITLASKKTSFDINDNSLSTISQFAIDGNTLLKHKAFPHWFFMIIFESTHVLPFTMIFHLVLIDFYPTLTSMAKGTRIPQSICLSFYLDHFGDIFHSFLILLTIVTIVLALPLPSIFLTFHSLKLMPPSLVINFHLSL